MTAHQKRNGFPQEWEDMKRRLYTLERVLAGLSPLAGKVTVNVSSSTTGTETVVFPDDSFAEAPVVVATAHGALYVAQVGLILSTSAVIRVTRIDGVSDTADVDVEWMALPEET